MFLATSSTSSFWDLSGHPLVAVRLALVLWLVKRPARQDPTSLILRLFDHWLRRVSNEQA